MTGGRLSQDHEIGGNRKKGPRFLNPFPDPVVIAGTDGHGPTVTEPTADKDKTVSDPVAVKAGHAEVKGGVSDPSANVVAERLQAGKRLDNPEGMQRRGQQLRWLPRLPRATAPVDMKLTVR